MNCTIEHIVQQLSTAYDYDQALALAFWIAEERAGLSRSDVLLRRDPIDIPNLSDTISRLLMHEPVQYIFGHTEWLGLDLLVTPATLIPRPETAELIGLLPWSTQPLRVLDIGTGSGCIAIAVKRARPMWQVTGIDISSEALAVARQNAMKNGVAVQFEQRDILQGAVQEAYPFDLVISNPPYIMDSEKSTMESNVLDHEPHSALFVSDEDPLLFYRAIAQQRIAPQLYFEINEQLGRQTAQLLHTCGYDDVEIHQDIYGKERFITATRTADVL